MKKNGDAPRSPRIELVECDVYICGAQDNDSGIYNLRYDWTNDIDPAGGDLSMIVWFEFLGTRSERAFFIRDVFRLHADQEDAYSAGASPRDPDYEVAAAKAILCEAERTIVKQLTNKRRKKNSLSGHVQAFETLFKERLDNLEETLAGWRREEQDAAMWEAADEFYSSFPIPLGRACAYRTDNLFLT